MNAPRVSLKPVKGDLDGFFGLAVDNLVQVLVIVALCTKICGFSESLIYTRVLPGIAVSLLIGNIYYALHAMWIARRDGNATCTALPYGINTPSVFAYILFILAPVYARYSPTLGPEAAGDLAWKLGLLACIGSGIIEFLGAFIGGWIRRVTPRAALLSALAAIGVIFIASPFAFQIFERPLIAIIPMFVVLIGYFARVRFPLGLPSGFVAVIIGAILAWTIPLAVGPRVMDFESVKLSAHWIATSVDALKMPTLCWNEILELLQNDKELLLSFLGVIVPMGLINAIGSLQNIESAEAAGDKFSTGPCMAVNGIGSIAAGLFGSCFPTTIYIGHPGWKALGARYWYSIINGVFFTLIFLLGLGAVVVSIVPMEAGIAIVMWIGIIITAQSYEAVPKRHYPAVAIAFFPAVAMMAVFVLPQVLRGVGAEHGILQMMHMHGANLDTIRTDDWWPSGIFALAGANSGFIITCIFISAISAFLIDRRFKTAGVWCILAAAVTLMGFQHAYRVEPDPNPPHQITMSAQELLVWQRSEPAFKDTAFYLERKPGAYWHRGYRIAAGYFAAAILLLLIHALRTRGRGFKDIEVDMHGGSSEPPDEYDGLPAAPPTPRRAPPQPEIEFPPPDEATRPPEGEQPA